MDETAFKLLWLAQWKLQQESEHMEPKLTKMIGHLSVYQKAAQYMEEHDVSNLTIWAPTQDVDHGQVEDTIFGKEDRTDVLDEFSELLTHDSAELSQQSEEPSRTTSSVLVTEVEVDAEGERNPFSDDEEVSSRGEDDMDWSSDEETEFGSVSSFDEENDADSGDIANHRALEEKKGDVDMDPIWRLQDRETDLPPDFDGWSRYFPPLVRPGTPSPTAIDGIAIVGAS
ncbi:uncharacterized protein A1O5_08774 [Cladophialophora psammophila CBS 110553]|uniref:Uncharacterized protein n=1 Tax=Cladophialophora psammophila CBS 110553 TaxID=1182543 RepID=W9XCJ3_9EURO|nr:uncharacterized protein A1O5_08774 [Cladophialophora psammophila CBS 110553]EXJ68159.1 hypothetical protein A1O5_08774 [Cladophialophora psammophila CBS 110553]